MQNTIRQAIIITCILGSLLIILDSINAVNSILLLVLVGVIPGTDTVVPPIDIMVVTAMAIAVIIFRAILWPLMRSAMLVQKSHLHTKRTSRRAA